MPSPSVLAATRNGTLWLRSEPPAWVTLTSETPAWASGAAVWENVDGLLVDDGSTALGTLVALLVVGTYGWVTMPQPTLAKLGGPLLFVLLMGLLVVNPYWTGRGAARKMADGPSA